jgi:hypothetical protein
MKRAMLWLGLVLLLLLSGCYLSDLDVAEDSLSRSYRELQKRRSNLETTNAAMSSIVSSRMDAVKLSRETQYHQIAKSGGFGVGEQLVAAKKMLNDPTYENRLFESESESKRKAEFAASRWESLKETQQAEKLDIRKYMPELKAALEKYERAYQAQESKTGQRPKVSEKTEKMVMDIKYALISDEHERRMEEIEKENQKGSAKRK